MAQLRYLKGATSVLKMGIMYPIDSKNGILKKFLYFLWSVFFMGNTVLMIIQCLWELTIKSFNLSEENFLIMNTTIYSLMVVKFIILNYNRKNLQELVQNINTNFFYETDNGVELVTMENCTKFLDKVPIYWTISLISSALFLSMQPLMSGTRAMPVPGWFPYDYTKTPYYELSYIWQLICQFNLGIMYGASDMIYPSLTVAFGQQFKILASNMKNSLFYSLIQSGIAKEVVGEFKNDLGKLEFMKLYGQYQPIFSLLEAPGFHRININYFKRNIQHHQKLLSFCKDMNNILESFLLVEILAAFFNVVFIAFSLIMTGDYSQAMGLCSYVFFASTELLIYSYSGQILTQNSDFIYELYDSPWYFCCNSFKTTMNIVQIQLKEPIFTKAGNYFMLCCPLFITLIRSIFSYVALLDTLVNRE